MKNKLFTYTIFFCLIISKFCFADPFIFQSAEIEITNEGNLINAKNGKAISADNNLEIEAEDFLYNQNLNLLEASKGEAFIKSDNLKIEFNDIKLDQKKSIFEAKNNVKIFDLENKLLIETDYVLYNLKTRILESNTNSTLKDEFDNILSSNYFSYDLNKNILKLKSANLKDVDHNNFFIDLAFINTKSNKLFGKDTTIDLSNKSFNKDNEPRLKGKSITYDNNITEISKGAFTTCKRRKDKCPPWQLSAEKIQHNKEKQVINYKNALLKVYDVPVMYFPKFFHPDPTVKRRSGFLIPTLKNSNNSEGYLSLPFFYAISINKDMTFTPRIYNEKKILLQSEFRQVNKNSSHTSDISLFQEKDQNSKTHFFYKYEKTMNYLNFENVNLDLNLEKTSNDTYLKLSKLTSPLITSYEVMENSLSFDLNSEDLSIDTDLIVYEDLNKNNHSDKYEYVLPRINLDKKIENKTDLSGNFSFKSKNLIRNYETNIFEKTNINDLVFNSNPIIYNNGLYNNYDFIIKNVNSNSQNSDRYEEKSNYYFSGLFQYNSSLPLIKENESYQNILKPKLALKISPENNTKNLSEEEIRLDTNNIYNLERLSSNDTIESGLSITYGNDFKIYDKSNSRDLFTLKLANNLRLNENSDLPKTNQLHKKTSDFFGGITFNPNNYLDVKYNVSRKNNIKDLSYQNLITKISLNNLVTTFDYLNENNTLSKNSYLLNTTTYNLNKSNNIVFETRENKSLDLTEYYKFIYQYKNDCLAASIEYDKQYYEDRDVKPEENIFLKLTIIPFGETSSPNIKN